MTDQPEFEIDHLECPAKWSRHYWRFHESEGFIYLGIHHSGYIDYDLYFRRGDSGSPPAAAIAWSNRAGSYAYWDSPRTERRALSPYQELLRRAQAEGLFP